MNQKQTYNYTTKEGNENTVHCTRLEYLFLKLNYGIDGLTPREYLEYKQLSSENNGSRDFLKTWIKAQKTEINQKDGYIKYLEMEVSFLIELLTEDQLTQYQNHQEQNKV